MKHDWWEGMIIGMALARAVDAALDRSWAGVLAAAAVGWIGWAGLYLWRRYRITRR